MVCTKEAKIQAEPGETAIGQSPKILLQERGEGVDRRERVK